MIYQLNSPAKSSLSKQYYFQLLPVQLIFRKPHKTHPQVQPARMHNYKITVHKGIQKFDQTRVPVSVFCGSSDTSVRFQKSHMVSFYLPIFNPNRQVSFTIKIHSDPNKQREFQQIGSFQIESNNYVNQFNQNERKMHEETINITEDLAMSFELYIQHTRIQLEKLLKLKHPEFYFIQADKSDSLSNSSKDKVTSAFGGKEAMISPNKYITRKQQGFERQRKNYTKQSSQQSIPAKSSSSGFDLAKNKKSFGGSTILQATKTQSVPIKTVVQSQIYDTQPQQNPAYYNPRDKYTPNINRYQRPSKGESTNTSYELKRESKNSSNENGKGVSQSYEVKKETTVVQKPKQQIKRSSSYQRKNIYSKNTGLYVPSRESSQVQNIQAEKQQTKAVQEPKQIVQQTPRPQQKCVPPEQPKQSQGLIDLPNQLPQITPNNTQTLIEAEIVDQKIVEQNKVVDEQIKQQQEIRNCDLPEYLPQITPQNTQTQQTTNIHLQQQAQTKETYQNERKDKTDSKSSVLGSEGAEKRQEIIEQRPIQKFEQKQQYNPNRYHHSYSAHGDEPEIVTVGINQPAHQVHITQQVNRQEENTSQRETDAPDNQTFEQDKFNQRSEYSQREQVDHIHYTNKTSIYAVAPQSGKDYEEQDQFTFQIQKPAAYQNEQIQKVNFAEEKPTQNYQQMIEAAKIERIQSFEEEVQYKIKINLSSERIEDQPKEAVYEQQVKPEQFKQIPEELNQAFEQQQPEVQIQHNYGGNVMEQSAKQSVTFQDQQYKQRQEEQGLKQEEQGLKQKEQGLKQEEQALKLIVNATIPQEVRQDASFEAKQQTQQKAYDAIIINQQKSKGRENPILVNNDDVLSPQERETILNLDLLGGQSPVEIQIDQNFSNPSNNHSQRKQQEQLLMRGKNLEHHLGQAEQQQVSQKKLRRTNSDTLLTKLQKQQIKKKRNREYGIGSLIILALVLVMSYLFLTLDGAKYTGRKIKTHRKKQRH